MAKLADARDLKSRAPKGAYRFNSGPGHHAISFVLIFLPRSSRHSKQENHPGTLTRLHTAQSNFSWEHRDERVAHYRAVSQPAAANAQTAAPTNPSLGLADLPGKRANFQDACCSSDPCGSPSKLNPEMGAESQMVVSYSRAKFYVLLRLPTYAWKSRSALVGASLYHIEK